MQRVAKVFVAVTVLSAVMAGSPVGVQAQVPTVKELYDRFAAAVGGRDAWDGITGRTEKGTADFTFAGLSGSYVRYLGAPNLTRMLIDLGMVRLDNGFDGEKGWIHQGEVLQRMPADQEKAAAENAQSGATFLDPDRYSRAEVQGKETFDGSEAWKVAVTTRAGLDQVEYFDAVSGLRIGTVVKSTTGEQRVTYRDYKDFDGRKLSTRVIQSTPQGDVIINITAVTFGMPDAELFKAPANLR